MDLKRFFPFKSSIAWDPVGDEVTVSINPSRSANRSASPHHLMAQQYTRFCSSRVKKKPHLSPIFKHVSAYAYTNETMKRSLISISLTGFKWSSLSCQNVEWDANSCSEFEFNFWCYLYFDLAHWQPLLWRWILHAEDRKRKTIKNGWIVVMLRHIQTLYGWLQSLNPGCQHVLHRGWSYFSHRLNANFPQQRSYYHTQVS